MRRNGRLYVIGICVAAMSLAVVVESQQAPDAAAFRDRSRQFSANMEKNGLAQPFKGITANGTVQPGLFAIRSTGVPTTPVRAAADAFLASLTPEQRKKILLPVDDDEWRKWANPHAPGCRVQRDCDSRFRGCADDRWRPCRQCR